MGHRFAELTFTPAVQAVQQLMGSHRQYQRMMTGKESNHLLGEREHAFLAERDSFYMATVTETGWPYVQHRGGPAGFLKPLSGNRIGFADFRGNLQYISVGGLSQNDRVALILMDYANQVRLKILGRAAVQEVDADLRAQLADPQYNAHIERAIVISVEAFDWNCPQHITPRYSEADVERMLAPMKTEIANLKAELDKAKAGR